MSSSPPIIVAGMHRSGTSLVASILSSLGVSLGDHLLAADRDNQRGYFEDVDFLALNRELLSAATSSEDGGHPDWGWTESESLDRNAFVSFRERASALIEARTGANQGRRWGWKDPRTAVALDFWDSIVPDARFVFVYRHPWEVADSMQRLGAAAFLRRPDYAWRIWAFYNRCLLDFHGRHRERTLLVSSDAARRDPGKLSELLQARLGLSPAEPGRQVQEIVDPNLFQTQKSDDPLVALSVAARSDCAELLAELDRAADLSGADLWSQSPPRPRLAVPAGAAAPRLSIVVPCYDHGDYLIEAVASVERCVTEPCELILVNDGSRDPHTVAVFNLLRGLGYQVIDQENTGLASARNRGIEMARSAYILPLDADNRLRPDFVTAALQILDSQPEVGVVYGDRQDFGLRNSLIEIRPFDFDILLACNYIDACALMRKEVWSVCGGYDTEMPAPGLEDWDLWIGAAKRGWQFHHLPGAAFDYRVRPNSMSAALTEEQYPQINSYVINKHRSLYSKRLPQILVAAQRSTARLLQLRIDYEHAQAEHNAGAGAARPEDRQHRVLRLQQDQEERSRRTAILQKEVEDKSRHVTQLQHDLEVKSQQVSELAADLEARSHQMAALDAAARDNSRRITQLKEELENRSRQVSHFQDEVDQQSAFVEQLKNQLETVSGRLTHAEDELLSTRSKALALRGILNFTQPARAGLERYNSILERRVRSISRLLVHPGQAPGRPEPAGPALIESLASEIGRIGRPSSWWKLARAFGLLKWAPAGVPKTASERRALATHLNRALRAISKALSSEKTSPEERAIETTRLFQLCGHVREIARSVQLPTLFQSRTPLWSGVQWPRPGANSADGGATVTALFDAPWYLGQYPDVAASNVDPLRHYLEWGARERRNPNPVFDTEWYLARNQDVAAGELNPLQHYLDRGAREGRDPSPLFETSWYLANNPDVAASGLNPLHHYLAHGAREGRSPHPLFDAAFYLKENPELTGMNPLEYYLAWGAAVGDSPHPLFDAAWYLAQNPDVAQAGANPLLHYLDRGWREGRNPHSLFDSRWYLAENPGVAASGMNPLVHYVKCGAAEGRNPNPLFDSAWYKRQNPELEPAGINPFAHYLVRGAAEGRDPHPIFDSKYYLSQNPNATKTGLTPLEHYLLIGTKAGRGTHPLFNAEYYRNTYMARETEWVDPVRHYLAVGWKLGYRPNPTFDPTFYLHVHRDVAEAGQEPFSHYLQSGRTEKRITTAAAISFELRQPEFKIPREPVVAAAPVPSDVKAIAFYLPQFHTIPQNDLWWGKGFTEWTNVRRGKPNFEGHYQPHVPDGLGYYDLSREGVLEQQAALAQAAGLHGFCFYYYWFGGEVLLDLPVRRMVETGKPAFPFCICWANENWTRRWDGKDSDILIAQRHSAEDDFAFIRHIERIIRSENYIRIAGKPVLLVYRPSLLPDAKATLERWRTHVRSAGLGELHLVMVQSFSEGISPADYGFDAVVQFPPHLPSTPVTPVIRGKAADFTGYIYNYDEVRQRAIGQLHSAAPGSTLYPGVMPSWDNTARQGGRSSIWVNSSPEAYSEWLAEAVSLARAQLSPAERFVFINAWNEWAEGCHLEPDARFGYAWLNATALALRQPSRAPVIFPGARPHPEPPPETPIVVRPLAGPIRLVISTLFYHREDILTAFVKKLLPQLKVATKTKNLSCELFLSFNYQPSPDALGELRKLISQLLPRDSTSVHIIENSFNLGFGAGHNAIFEKTDSDVFIILNSDLHIEDDHWLVKFADRFQNSDAAILGLAENASRLREDGCGVLVGETGAAFDFVDGSVLAIRSDLAARFGLFSPSFDYFYFEDVDLNLRYRQMGLRIETLDIPCLHERSSSTRLLPKFAVESVLNQNRARFFQRWENYLTTRRLSNRLALHFRDADRQLQCASFAAIFGLLAEHPTAVLDLWGVHQQLVPLFQHPRIRLIPWWQAPRREDYLRCYELSLEAANTLPLAVRIAEQMSVDPAFQLARSHLESLLSSDAPEQKRTNKALIYLARPQVLFEGRQPEADSLLAAREPLLRKGFEIQYYSEYGTMETPAVPKSERRNWKYVACSSGLDLLADLASADVLVTSDGWAAELGQLLNKKTIVWLGSTSAGAAIWNFSSACAFFDSALNCLGCHERFGQPGRNVCLRGDQACLSSGLTHSFAETVGRFLDDGSEATAASKISWTRSITRRLKRSEQEKLEAWPETSAGSVLVLTPISPTLDPAVIRRARELAERTTNGMRGCRIVYDDTGEAPPRGSTFPHRLAAMTPLRQAMIDRHLRDERWVFWVDADLVDYPANLLEELISRAEGGIAAPLVLMEGDLSEPAYPAGFGPGRFYDIAGFIENDRWARFTQPYFDQPGPVYRLDSVGCCYLVNADLYRWGAKHELDHASKAFIAENRDWPDDAIKLNQSGPANSFTDHYSVCEFARKVAVPVQAFADLIAYHQRA
ncbi:MAG TPA: glycoside hydrolase family 99-like domain-containing protein [Chthoniobacterales bacterium]|nr:glycoside hydrolase family 99-like domain-containing protein [Chthoniobacterales bacterium]